MKQRVVRRLAVGMVLLLGAAVPVRHGPRRRPSAWVQNVGKLAFKDIRYLPRSLADLAGKKAYVIVCTSTTCPLVQKYLPKLKRLDEKYRGRGRAVSVAQREPRRFDSRNGSPRGRVRPAVSDSERH